MLNSNTIKRLDKMGFGLNIDKIELFIHYFNISKSLCNLDKYEYNYLQLVNILQSLKPNSKVLKDEYVFNNLEMDSFDKLFNLYGNKKCDIAYGKEDSHKINYIKEKSFIGDSCMDLIAVNNIEGIDIMCTYINGRVYRIYAISEHSKLYDFTNELKDNIPTFIEELACYNLVELRGKATITKDKYKKFNSTSCSTMYYLENNTNTSTISIIFDDIIFEEGYNTFETNWDKLEWLRDMGLNVPHHAMIRNVDRVQFESALEEFDSYFRNEDIESPRIYDKLGFNVKDNNNVSTVGYMICYDTDNVDHNTKFESTIKDIYIDIEESYIKIVSKKCNNGLTIETIDIDDIYNLDKYNIAIGNKIYFKVIEGKAIIDN